MHNFLSSREMKNSYTLSHYNPTLHGGGGVLSAQFICDI